MSRFSIFLLALGLAADSFAASVARGSRAYRPGIAHALIAAAVFAGAQILMPLVGWQIGVEFQPIVERIDHWIAFGILSALGLRMIYEGIVFDPEAPDARTPAFTLSALLLVAIATSIDSLVAGFGFGVLNVSVLAALAVIGATTFVLSFAGVYVGRHFGRRVGRYVEFAGGILLIGIGAKILADHTL
jgi:putative Mn2+ efflux pump MntP